MSDPVTFAVNADELIKLALKEDITSEDASTNAVIRKKTLGRVQLICKQDGIICGLPVNFDGSEALQTSKTQKFIQALKAQTSIPVICEDERFTTKMAHETLISEGMRREKRKMYVDALAAANILDGYLAKINKKGV